MRALVALTRLSLLHPIWTCTAVASLSVLFLMGIPRIQRETTLRTFLGPDNETVTTLDHHLETFGGGYPVIVAYSCTETKLCETVFDESALRMADEVVAALEPAFGVRAVLSPSNTPLMVPDGDELEIRRFVDDSGSVAVDRAALAAQAVQDPLWVRTLVSADGSVGAIVVEVGSSSATVQKAVATALEAALEPQRERGWTFHLVGELVDFVYAGVSVERDSHAMVPLMMVVLCGVLYVLLRSIALTVATVASMGIASLWTQGSMGWGGVPLNSLTAVTPSLVFAIGILDGIHVVAQFRRRCWTRGDTSKRAREEMLIETAEEIGGACLLTSLTTIAAFLAFAAAGIAAFVEFGLLAAWGVLAALILTFTLLPIVLASLSERALGSPGMEPAWEGLLGSITGTVDRGKTPILVTTALVTAVALIGVSRVRVEINPDQLLGETNQVTRWNHWVAKHLRQTETLEIALVLPEGVSFKEPAALDQVDRVSHWLEDGVERIAHPRSVLGPLRRLNRALHGGREEFERYEGTRAGNAQLAALLSMDDPGALDRWASTDGGRGDGAEGRGRDVLRISAEAESMPTAAQARVVAAVEARLAATLPTGWSYSLTGSVPMYLSMMSALQRNQLRCFAIAGLTIFVLMAFLLRSPGLSLAALIPAVIACVGVVGLLGWWDFALDPASTMVATIVLGVAVDDGIHLVSHYQRLRARGEGSKAAIGASLHRVGRPVIVTSLALAAAFWSLTLSPTSPVASFGFLAGLSVILALAGDLYVLPALLSWSGAVRAGRTQHVFRGSRT